MADPESLADNVSVTWRGRDWYHMPPNMMNKNKKDTASPLQCSCQKCRTGSHHEEMDKPRMWTFCKTSGLALCLFINHCHKKTKAGGNTLDQRSLKRQDNEMQCMNLDSSLDQGKNS